MKIHELHISTNFSGNAAFLFTLNNLFNIDILYKMNDYNN